MIIKRKIPEVNKKIFPFTDRVALGICKKFRFREKLFDINRDKFSHYFEKTCQREEV